MSFRNGIWPVNTLAHLYSRNGDKLEFIGGTVTYRQLPFGLL